MTSASALFTYILASYILTSKLTLHIHHIMHAIILTSYLRCTQYICITTAKIIIDTTTLSQKMKVLRPIFAIEQSCLTKSNPNEIKRNIHFKYRNLLKSAFTIYFFITGHFQETKIIDVQRRCFIVLKALKISYQNRYLFSLFSKLFYPLQFVSSKINYKT